MLSSFSLVVLQGVMGGLQNGLIKRSKDVKGYGVIEVKNNTSVDDINFLKEKLNKNKVLFVPELELELLAKHKNRIYPVKLHGIDTKSYKPEFLKGKDFSEVILASDLGFSLQTYLGGRVNFISPAASDFVFVESPRQSFVEISDFIITNIPEVDSVEAWSRIGIAYNLLGDIKINKLRLFGKDSFEATQAIWDRDWESKFRLVSWETQHETLVWALGLETNMMLFIFCGMCFLLGICIVSGNLIFFNKVKSDLASFWILGLDRDSVFNLIKWFSQGLAFIFCALGLLAGVLFLLFLESGNFTIMPEFFIERKVPVYLNSFEVIISFLIPYAIAGVFSYITFKLFKSDNISFITLLQKQK